MSEKVKLEVYDATLTKDFVEASEIYADIFLEYPTVDRLNALIKTYNGCVNLHNSTLSEPRSDVLLDIDQEFTNFKEFLELKKGDMDRRIREEIEFKKKERLLLRMPIVERFIRRSRYDEHDANIVRLFWNSLSDYCVFNFTHELVEKFLTIYAEKFIDNETIKLDREIIKNYVSTLNMSGGYFVGVAGDGERALRTIVATCRGFSKYIGIED